MEKAALEIFIFSEDIITASGGGLVNGGDMEEGSGEVEIASLDINA